MTRRNEARTLPRRGRQAARDAVEPRRTDAFPPIDLSDITPATPDPDICEGRESGGNQSEHRRFSRPCSPWAWPGSPTKRSTATGYCDTAWLMGGHSPRRCRVRVVGHGAVEAVPVPACWSVWPEGDFRPWKMRPALNRLADGEAIADRSKRSSPDDECKTDPDGV